MTSRNTRYFSQKPDDDIAVWIIVRRGNDTLDSRALEIDRFHAFMEHNIIIIVWKFGTSLRIRRVRRRDIIFTRARGRQRSESA